MAIADQNPFPIGTKVAFIRHQQIRIGLVTGMFDTAGLQDELDYENIEYRVELGFHALRVHGRHLMIWDSFAKQIGRMLMYATDG